MARTSFSGPVRSENGFTLGATALAANYVAVPDAATYTLLAADTGKVHLMPNLTADCTISLPAEQAGLSYKFVYSGVAADAQDWIITSGSDTNYFTGGVVHLDSDSDAAGDEVVIVYPDGNSNSKLTVNTPNGGTVIEVICTGTLWVVNGQAVGATAPVFADQ
jgi:hypothetical protein